AAAFWRLSLLPDWHLMPMLTPKGPITRNGLVLFLPPLGLLFVIVIHLGKNWLVTGPDEARAAWCRRSGLLPMAVGMLMILAQALNISRSLGYDLSLDGQTFARFVLVAVGILTMVRGNVMPK